MPMIKSETTAAMSVEVTDCIFVYGTGELLIASTTSSATDVTAAPLSSWWWWAVECVCG